MWGWSAVCQSQLLCPAKDLGCKFKLEKPEAVLNTAHVWNLCQIPFQIMDNDSPDMLLKGLRKWGDIQFHLPKDGPITADKLIRGGLCTVTDKGVPYRHFLKERILVLIVQRHVLPFNYLKKGGQVRKSAALSCFVMKRWLYASHSSRSGLLKH